MSQPGTEIRDGVATALKAAETAAGVETATKGAETGAGVTTALQGTEKDFHLAEYNQASTAMESLMNRVTDLTKLGIVVSGGIYAWLATQSFHVVPASGQMCAKIAASWAAYLPSAMVLLFGIYSAAAAWRWRSMSRYLQTVEKRMKAAECKGIYAHLNPTHSIGIVSIVAYVAFFLGTLFVGNLLKNSIEKVDACPTKIVAESAARTPTAVPIPVSAPPPPSPQ